MNYQLNIVPKFPARVDGDDGIAVTKENGVYTIASNYADVPVGTVPNPATTYVLTQQPNGSYAKVTVSSISGAAVGDSLVTAAGSTTPRSLSNRFSDIPNVLDFGAVGDGVHNDGPAFLAAAESLTTPRGFVFVPEGNYAGVTAASVPTTKSVGWLGSNNDVSQFFDLPGIQFGMQNKRLAAVRRHATDLDYATILASRRNDNVGGDPSAFNTGIFSITTVLAGAGCFEWAVCGQVIWSGTQGEGGVGVSGVASKTQDAIGAIWGGHFQARDSDIGAAPINAGVVHGIEVNCPVIGLDSPTANSGFGNRWVLDVIGVTDDTRADWNTAPGNSGYGECGVGVMVRTQGGADGGYLRFGVAVRESSGNPRPINTGLYIGTNGDYGMRMTGNHAIAGILLSGNDSTGLVLGGTYTSGNALRVQDGQAIAWEATGTIRSWYVPTIFKFGTGTTERVGLDIGGGSMSLRINALKVVGQRATGWTAATGTATRSTFATAGVTLPVLAEHVKALIDDLTSHGLIGT